MCAFSSIFFLTNAKGQVRQGSAKKKEKTVEKKIKSFLHIGAPDDKKEEKQAESDAALNRAVEEEERLTRSDVPAAQDSEDRPKKEKIPYHDKSIDELTYEERIQKGAGEFGFVWLEFN